MILSPVEKGTLCLQREKTVASLRNCSFNEGPGEGYHRDTNAELERASASCARTLLGVPRTRHNFKRGNHYTKPKNITGRRVFRYEWQNYKRLVQPDGRSRWNSKKMPVKDFYNKVYNLDPVLADNWPKFCAGKTAERSSVPSPTERVQLDYLQKLFEPKKWYSVPRPDKNGDMGGPDTWEYMQVVTVQICKAQPKVVRTHMTRIGDMATIHESIDVLYLCSLQT